MKSWGNAPETEESGKAGAMPQKRETADDRQRGGVCAGCLPLFSFSEYLYSLGGGEDLKTTCFDYME